MHGVTGRAVAQLRLRGGSSRETLLTVTAVRRTLLPMPDQPRWLVTHSRGLPGVVPGTIVELEQDGGVYRVIKVGVGQMGSFAAATTDTENTDDHLRLRNAPENVELEARLDGNPDSSGDELPLPVVVWNYPGRTQADAAVLFQDHARELAGKGYRPVAQSWAEGRPGAGRVLALGLYSQALRPNGFLTVTYQLEAPIGESATPQAADLIDQIRRLGDLRDEGLISQDEYQAKKTELLGRL